MIYKINTNIAASFSRKVIKCYKCFIYAFEELFVCLLGTQITKFYSLLFNSTIKFWSNWLASQSSKQAAVKGLVVHRVMNDDS